MTSALPPSIHTGYILSTLPAASEQLSPLTIDEHVKSLGELLLTQRSSTCVFEQKESREQHKQFPTPLLPRGHPTIRFVHGSPHGLPIWSFEEFGN